MTNEESTGFDKYLSEEPQNNFQEILDECSSGEPIPCDRRYPRRVRMQSKHWKFEERYNSSDGDDDHDSVRNRDGEDSDVDFEINCRKSHISLKKRRSNPDTKPGRKSNIENRRCKKKLNMKKHKTRYAIPQRRRQISIKCNCTKKLCEKILRQIEKSGYKSLVQCSAEWIKVHKRICPLRKILSNGKQNMKSTSVCKLRSSTSQICNWHPLKQQKNHGSIYKKLYSCVFKTKRPPHVRLPRVGEKSDAPDLPRMILHIEEDEDSNGYGSRFSGFSKEDPFKKYSIYELFVIKEILEPVVLEGVVAYVDVISKKHKNRSRVIGRRLEKLGAKVVRIFKKSDPVSVVVFHDGHISTYIKAKKRGIPLVSHRWIDECKKRREKVPASEFPASKLERYESSEYRKELKKRKLLNKCGRILPYNEKKRKPREDDSSEEEEMFSEPVVETPKPAKPSQKTQPPVWLTKIEGTTSQMALLVNLFNITEETFAEMLQEPIDSQKYEFSSLPIKILFGYIKEMKESQMQQPSTSANPSTSADNTSNLETASDSALVESIHPVLNSFSDNMSTVSSLSTVYSPNTMLEKERNRVLRNSESSSDDHSDISETWVDDLLDDRTVVEVSDILESDVDDILE